MQLPGPTAATSQCSYRGRADYSGSSEPDGSAGKRGSRSGSQEGWQGGWPVGWLEGSPPRDAQLDSERGATGQAVSGVVWRQAACWPNKRVLSRQRGMRFQLSTPAQL